MRAYSKPKKEGGSGNEAIEYGEWSEVKNVNTAEEQTIDPTSLGTHAFIERKKGQELQIIFNKPGIVYSQNPILFGKVSWQIKALVAQHASDEDQMACLVVGKLSCRARFCYETNYRRVREGEIIALATRPNGRRIAQSRAQRSANR